MTKPVDLFALYFTLWSIMTVVRHLTDHIETKPGLEISLEASISHFIIKFTVFGITSFGDELFLPKEAYHLHFQTLY
jgi:hypothetical protein